MSAIAPSGKALARAVGDLVSDVQGPILEVGAGNGALTGALIKPGRPLIAIEHDRRLAGVVARRHPGIQVAVCDARLAPFVLRDMEVFQVEAIVSGLGLKTMAGHDLENIAWAMDKCLLPGGRWIQFSYSASSPLPGALQEKYGLAEARLGRVMQNLPPAYLFSYTKS